MNAFITQTIAAVRAERQRRIDGLSSETLDALNQWSDVDDPFISEFCLLVLLAAFHQAERELVRLGTQIALAGQYTTSRDYHLELNRQRQSIRSRKEFLDRFGGGALAEYRIFHVLNLIANCYKHDPSMRPSEELIDYLGLPRIPRPPLVGAYAPLPESHCFREGLALWLGLGRDSSYCDIAETMLLRLDVFLSEFPKPERAPVRAPLSLTEFEC